MAGTTGRIQQDLHNEEEEGISVEAHGQAIAESLGWDRWVGGRGGCDGGVASPCDGIPTAAHQHKTRPAAGGAGPRSGGGGLGRQRVFGFCKGLISMQDKTAGGVPTLLHAPSSAEVHVISEIV